MADVSNRDIENKNGTVKENLWWLWLIMRAWRQGSWEAFIIGFDSASIDALMISVLDSIHKEETRLPFVSR